MLLVKLLFHLRDLLVKLSEDFIPFDIKAVHFLNVRLLNFLQLGFVSFLDIFDLSFFSQFLKGLNLAFTAFSFNIFTGVLILFLFHDEVITSS